MDREYIIAFILNHDPKTNRTGLEKLSNEALLMIKTQIVLKILSKESDG